MRTRKEKRKAAVSNVCLKPGDKVIICTNPHDPRAENVVGTVIVYRQGAGFGGSDLVDVHYKSPHDGQGHTRCFGLALLAAATPAELIRLAEKHESEAASLRTLAKALSR